MMNIHVLSAGDRNNYGDLLFPLIVKKYIFKYKPTYEFENYGIIVSDLSSFGALPTKSLTDLKNNIKNESTDSMIIVAGGEVLGGGDWLNILRFVSPLWDKINSIRVFRGLVKKTDILNRLSKNRYECSRPFILDGKVFQGKKVIYNAIGAISIRSLLSKKIYKNYFENIQYLSVRDQISKNNFNHFGIKPNLSPDSALIMSDLLNEDLVRNISVECQKIVSEKYIFLQLGNNKGPDDIKKFIEVIKKLSQKINAKVLLCPIGLALGHGDDVILKEIETLEKEFSYYEPKNLYETMFLLKNTEIYIGTSLHGMVTAQSFGRPYFLFTEKISKLKFYIETWNSANTNCFGDFYDYEEMLKRYSQYDLVFENKTLQNQKQMVYENFKRIFENA